MNDFSAAVDAVNNGEIFRILAKPWNRVELLGTVRQAFNNPVDFASPDPRAMTNAPAPLPTTTTSVSAETALTSSPITSRLSRRVKS